MLERRPALAAATPYRSSILQMGEMRCFSLYQVASKEAALPAKVGTAGEYKGCTVLRIGLSQFWFIAPHTDDLAAELKGLGAVTPLSHSRVRIFLEGDPARDVLAKGIPLDFHKSAFKPGMFAMTGLHHTPVLVHCVSETRFELYALRTFAMSVWEWLADAALEFAD